MWLKIFSEVIHIAVPPLGAHNVQYVCIDINVHMWLMVW